MVWELSLKPSVLPANQSSLQCQNFAGRRLPVGEAGLWGASLLRDAGGGIDDVLPAPGSARDVIPPCRRLRSQTKAELSARGRLDPGYPRQRSRCSPPSPAPPREHPAHGSKLIFCHRKG